MKIILNGTMILVGICYLYYLIKNVYHIEIHTFVRIILVIPAPVLIAWGIYGMYTNSLFDVITYGWKFWKQSLIISSIVTIIFVIVFLSSNEMYENEGKT